MPGEKRQWQAGATCHDIRATITEQIVAAVETGAPKFEMPWHHSGPSLGRPVNAVSGRPYRGANVIALWAAALKKGYGSGTWATYHQWASLSAQVQKGEKGTPIVFYKEIERATNDAEAGEDIAETIRVARASWVFNAEQVSGWRAPEPVTESVVAVINRAEDLIEVSGADIRYGSDRACYHPVLDYIEMPNPERFTGTSTSTATESYYATHFHELIHWTGHESRLNRDLFGHFGSNAYAMEELVAELGAAFLCADIGVSNAPRLDHAAYVNSWLKVLRRDTRGIFAAAAKAGTAVEYLKVP